MQSGAGVFKMGGDDRWQVKGGMMYDNAMVTDDVAEASGAADINVVPVEELRCRGMALGLQCLLYHERFLCAYGCT